MQVLELPHSSVMVYVLVTVNLFAHEPAVVTSDEVTVIAPAQLSVAAPPAAWKPANVVAAAGTAEAHDTVTAVAHDVITGAV